jgi:hypothetical protein
MISREFGDYIVSITQDGFVAVDGEIDKKEVLKVLNTIFAASIFKGYQFHAATQNDLVEVEMQDGDIENIWGSPNLPRKIATIDPKSRSRSSNYYNPSLIKREIIDIDDLEDIIENAVDIYSDDGLTERVHFALQAYTHHKNGEYAQAFLLSWISIEQYLNTYTNSLLKEELGVNNRRRDKITDSPNWTSTHKIEILELIDGVSEAEYDDISEFRTKRNKVVHEMETVDEDSSKKIIEFTFSILEDESKPDTHVNEERQIL